MDGEALTPDEIAERLGIAVGEAIVSEPEAREPAHRPWPACLGGPMVLAAILALSVGVPAAGLSLARVAGVVTLGLVLLITGLRMVGVYQQAQAEAQTQPWIPLGDPVLEADAFGLRVSYPVKGLVHQADWTDVQGIEACYGPPGDDGRREVKRWLVTTEGGGSFHFRADAPNAERILAAARHVLEARQQGRTLWDPGAVPEGAISRMTGASLESPERGISRTDA